MKRGVTLFVVLGLIVTAGLALFGSPFADSDPDGLERAAIERGFADQEREHGLADSPLAGYSVKGVRNERMSTGLAGLIGVTVTFVLAAGFFFVVRRRRHPDEARDGEPA